MAIVLCRCLPMQLAQVREAGHLLSHMNGEGNGLFRAHVGQPAPARTPLPLDTAPAKPELEEPTLSMIEAEPG